MRIGDPPLLSWSHHPPLCPPLKLAAPLSFLATPHSNSPTPIWTRHSPLDSPLPLTPAVGATPSARLVDTAPARRSFARVHERPAGASTDPAAFPSRAARCPLARSGSPARPARLR